jgi:hypothetical protein
MSAALGREGGPLMQPHTYDYNIIEARRLRGSADEHLVLPRIVYSYNLPESDGTVAVPVDQSLWLSQYVVGGTFHVEAGGPGCGSITYRITRIDAEGLWGVVARNTMRELTLEDVI